MKYLITALTLMIFLSSCTMTPTGDAGGFTVPKYSQKQRDQVITELKGCGLPPTTIEFLKDYKVLRDQARVN